MTAIKQLRKQKGISQQELAAMINVTQAAISQWELGSAKPTIENLVLLAKIFDCKVDDLIGK